MTSWEDVHRIALALPETGLRVRRDGLRMYEVKGKLFVWERPLRRRDVSELEALGEEVPAGPILGARTADLEAKEALLADDPAVFFTIPHFDGYASVLVRLDAIPVDELAPLARDAWLVRAPKRVATAWLDAERSA